jgi:penicillin-insensitive murein endopeptidase
MHNFIGRQVMPIGASHRQITERVAMRPNKRRCPTLKRIAWMLLALVWFGGLGSVSARAQDLGMLNPEPLPPLANPNSPAVPARELFARKTTPLPGPARSIGSYANGCLEGAVALPITGPAWQVMRVSRDRYWGHPSLVTFIERLAANGKKVGWNGLLIGDMAQPRGGPMLNGHTSHQIGLDVDIWFTPMPDRELTLKEREFDTARTMVAKDRRDVDPNTWTHERTELVRTAAQDPVVTRIFVNPAIKKAMCREAGADRSWLSKVRPWWGHDWHFHVRTACPPDSPLCKPQPPVGWGDQCGKELESWLKKTEAPPSPPTGKPQHNMKLAAMPVQCRVVVKAP